MSTILVIDDSELVNKMLCETLTSHGYDVIQAHDANAGYLSVRKQKPDLILLDIVLPDVNGVELCKTFRKYSETRYIPIILITGTASSTSEKVKGLQAGADDYILKPFEMDELLERVRAILRRAQAQPGAGAAALQQGLSTPPPLPTRSDDPISPQAKPFSIQEILGRALFAPASLPAELPPLSLFFLVALVVLISTGLMLAPGASTKPFMAALFGVVFWGFLVSVTVVAASLAGLPLKWKQGAQIVSVAASPLLLKLVSACVFSAWTTLSPFLFTAGPTLFTTRTFPGIDRLDIYELWSVGLLAIVLRKQSGASKLKVAIVVAGVWILTALAARALLYAGGAV